MSNQDSSADLNELVTFYDPHPGLMGAELPIPKRVKAVADELNGKTMPLGEGLERLRVVTHGKMEVVPKDKYISLDIEINFTRNYFRVIRYR